MIRYIQGNYISSTLEDLEGLVIEVNFKVITTDDLHEGHGLHRISYTNIIIKYAAVVKIQNGREHMSSIIEDTRVIEDFLLDNLSQFGED